MKMDYLVLFGVSPENENRVGLSDLVLVHGKCLFPSKSIISLINSRGDLIFVKTALDCLKTPTQEENAILIKLHLML